MPSVRATPSERRIAAAYRLEVQVETSAEPRLAVRVTGQASDA